MNSQTKSRKGFTLIELLVVVLILGILVAVALPSYLSSVQTSKTNTANANAKTILTAIQAYGVKNSNYPANQAAVFANGSSTLEDMGGTIPANPCSANAGAPVSADWTVTFLAGPPATAEVQGVNSGNCTTAPTQYSVEL